MQTKVIIIDDHVMVREGIKQLLEIDGDIIVVGEAGNGEEGLQIMEQTDPDVILLDINMPKMNGLEVLQKIKESGIKRDVLILTIHDEVEYVKKAMEIGVRGYVLKDSSLEILRKAIFTVKDGGTFIEANLIPLLTAALQEEQSIDDVGLTKREIEVLELIAKGMYNKEIANALHISEKTVKNHVSSIFKKIDVTDRTQAAVYAIKNEYVDI